jgi:putative 2OG-Fe(II) oxygenase
MCLIVKNLLKKGVTKGNSQPLSELEIKELESLILKNKDNHSKKKEVFKNIVGIDNKIDEFLEKILSNSEIQNTLLKLLGENYLLRHVSARFNEPDDKGLPMHQDSLGEVSLTFLVNNQEKGSTFFFPGSQLIPINNHLAQKISWGSIRLINLIKYIFVTANGKAGNYYYFLNRTWHGRLPGIYNNTNISLFFAFFPVSARRKDLINYDLEYNSKIIGKSITQPFLKKILSRQNYEIAIKNYENSNNIPALSMRVNSFKVISKNIFYFIYVISKILFLEILFLPIKIKRFLKL